MMALYTKSRGNWVRPLRSSPARPYPSQHCLSRDLAQTDWFQRVCRVVKDLGLEAWQAAIQTLNSLRDRGYMTRWNKAE